MIPTATPYRPAARRAPHVRAAAPRVRPEGDR
jgi:hypothetical protein